MAVPTQDVTNTFNISLSILAKIFLSYLTLCNASESTNTSTLDLTLCTSFIMLLKKFKYSPFFGCFLFYRSLYWDYSLVILITSILPTFISIPLHVPISISLALFMP
jgi:hypothetical protein